MRVFFFLIHNVFMKKINCHLIFYLPSCSNVIWTLNQFWRIRDGCLLLDLSAHSSWVTAVRLLPPDINSSDDEYVNVNSLPVGLLTASSDGVIKRWEVGAACLPSPSTPIPAGMANFTDLQQLRRISLQSMLSTRSNDRSNAVHGLWTDVFDVWFGPHASLLVVGRRRHSSDLQVVLLCFKAFIFVPCQVN